VSHLFVYGTLLFPAVVRAVVGRDLAAPLPASLDGFARRRVIGEIFPALVPEPAERVEGLLYRGLDATTWRRLDDFEGELYERRAVPVTAAAAGAPSTAYVYVLRPAWRHRAGAEPWDPGAFEREHLAAFAARLARSAAPRAVEPPLRD
jgi:gamma-glutamylcyclotransferase (GGCT)/AIG2-like uncharacterized protein YtfP